MDLPKMILIVFIILILCDMCLSATGTQSTPSTSKKPRPRKKPARKKQNLKNHIQCFECFRDYSSTAPFNGDDLCYNPNLNPDMAIEEMLVTCPKGSSICQVDIHRLNGVFIALERKCAPACACLCKNSGYGMDREICSECSHPIVYADFDNETLPERTCHLPIRKSPYTSSGNHDSRRLNGMELILRLIFLAILSQFLSIFPH